MQSEDKSLEEEDWVREEMKECRFRDDRLSKRASKLVRQMTEKIGEGVPAACQDWANTKAAYRFFSNETVSEEEILSGHFAATKARMESVDDRILILHDTTEFSYKRDEESTSLGLLTRFPKYGKTKGITLRGILMHSSLAVTPQGLPLGLAAIKFWTREQFKGCNALKRKINPTRVPIEEKESFRWLENLRQATALAESPANCVHIGDRESDIYELFCTAVEAKTYFLVRTCVDRLAGGDGETIASLMNAAPKCGLHRVSFKDRKGMEHKAVLELKFRRIDVHPPISKRNRYPTLTLTVIHAYERGNPEGREKIEWKLLTNIPIETRSEAIEKLDWYAMRWKIETFHKILKSGCKAEESKLRSSERLVNFIAICCIVGWRIFWITMLNRIAPDELPTLGLTQNEVTLLNQVIEMRIKRHSKEMTLSDCLIEIARLGGYLARANDPPPGNLVMWRGMRRLADMQIGFQIGAEFVGN